MCIYRYIFIYIYIHIYIYIYTHIHTPIVPFWLCLYFLLYKYTVISPALTILHMAMYMFQCYSFHLYLSFPYCVHKSVLHVSI